MKKITKNLLSLALLLTVFSLPLLVGAQFDPSTGSSTTGLPTDTLENTLVNIVSVLLTIVGILAVLGFVASGIMFITAGGNSERAETAKTWLIYSIIGVAVALIGYVVVGFVETLIDTTI